MKLQLNRVENSSASGVSPFTNATVSSCPLAISVRLICDLHQEGRGGEGGEDDRHEHITDLSESLENSHT